MDFDSKRMELWEKIVPPFKYDPEVPFFDMLVPTMDTVRFGYLMEKLLKVNHSVLFTGTTGVGKVVSNILILSLAYCTFVLMEVNFDHGKYSIIIKNAQ